MNKLPVACTLSEHELARRRAGLGIREFLAGELGHAGESTEGSA